MSKLSHGALVQHLFAFVCEFSSTHFDKWNKLSIKNVLPVASLPTKQMGSHVYNRMKMKGYMQSGAEETPNIQLHSVALCNFGSPSFVNERNQKVFF